MSETSPRPESPDAADLLVGVVGPGTEDPVLAALGEEVGRRLAEAGAVLVCGGLGGVMAAACRGARAAEGLTVGLLPGTDPSAANPWVRVALATGLGEMRNVLVARAAAALIAIGGGYGTLSEVAFALKIARPVVGLQTWDLLRPGGAGDQGIVRAADPEEAVALAIGLARAFPLSR